MDRRKFAKLLSESAFKASILEGFKTAALSPAEQQELVKRLSQGDNAAGAGLFNSCVRLLPNILSRYALVAANFDDLTGAAIEGIVDAIESCSQAGRDLDGGSFSDYVRKRIIRSIKSNIERTHKLSNYIEDRPDSLHGEASSSPPLTSQNLSNEQIRLLAAEISANNSLSEIEAELDVGTFVSEGTPKDQDSGQGHERQEHRASQFAALLMTVPKNVPYKSLVTDLASLSHDFRQRLAVELAPALNAEAQGMDCDTLDQKKELGRWVTAELERFGLAVQCPNTGKPAKLRATTGSSNFPDTGRFYFETDKNGKPTKSASFDKLPELQLIDVNSVKEPEIPTLESETHWREEVGSKPTRPGRKLT